MTNKVEKASRIGPDLDIVRMPGRVTNINYEKGYGFITGLDQQEYFFHEEFLDEDAQEDAEYIEEFDQLQPGDRVTFEPANTTKGLRAFKLRWGS